MYVVRNRARGTFLNFSPVEAPKAVETVNAASTFEDIADLVAAVFSWGQKMVGIPSSPAKFDIVKIGPEPVIINYVVVDEL